MAIHDSTEQNLIESVVATLELQAGTVTATELDRWRADAATRGWTPEGRIDGCEVMRHEASGCRVDLLIMPAETDAVLEAGASDTKMEAGADDTMREAGADGMPGEGRRYAFSSARLSGPDNAPFLADADLSNPRPDGTVTWIIAHREPAGADLSDTGRRTAETAETVETIAARPFQAPAWRAFLPFAALVLVTLAAASLLAWAAHAYMGERIPDGGSGTS